MAALPLSFVDALIKGAVVLAGAAVLARLLRGQSAAARHAVWTAALLAQLALPILALTLPSWDLPILPRGAAPAPAATPNAAPAIAVARTSPATAASARERIARRLPSTGTLLLAVWLAGFVLVLGRLGLGTATVARLRRRAQRVDDGEWLALAQRTAGGLGIRRPVTLLSGGQLQVPVTWGTVYPTVLLPHSADAWSDERRRLVLTHELAHVQRFDALTQFVGQIALAMFWMNPLVWLAVHRMAAERECACDDYVLRGGTVASTYAQELLEMVRSLAPSRGPAFAALAIAGRSDFESRLLAILSPNVPRRAMARGAAVAIAGVAALFVLPLASIRPVARREASPRRTAYRIAAVPKPIVATRLPAIEAAGERRPEPARSRRITTQQKALAADSARRRDDFAASSVAAIQACDRMVRIASKGQTSQIEITAQGHGAPKYARCEVSMDLSEDFPKRHTPSRTTVAITVRDAQDADTGRAAVSLNEYGPSGRDQQRTPGKPVSATLQVPMELFLSDSGALQLATLRNGKTLPGLKLTAKADSALVALLSAIDILRLYDTLQRTSPALGNRARTSPS